MRIFNENKTRELRNEEIDYTQGYLKDETLVIHHEEITGVEEQGHYEIIAEYPNGGKDVKYIIDVPGIEARASYDEKEEIKVYVKYTEKELKAKAVENLRKRRASECFPIINRGRLWYNRLTDARQAELDAWYTAWLDVTETLIVPDKPVWLEEKNDQTY